jgi:hypothetical protein
LRSCDEFEELTLDNAENVDNDNPIEAYKYKPLKSSKDKEAVLFNKTTKIFKCRQKKMIQKKNVQVHLN